MSYDNCIKSDPFWHSTKEPKFGKEYLLLDGATYPGTSDFTLNQIGQELAFQGKEVGIVPLCMGGKEMPYEEFKKIMDTNDPSYIIWNGAAAWRFWPILKDYNLSNRISLWYDDPFMPSEYFGVDSEISKSAMFTNIFCWDDHWCNMMQSKWGANAEPTHLAASPREYYTSDIHLTEDLVFIGNLHSYHEIERVKHSLPRIYRKVADEAEKYIKNFGIIPDWMRLINMIVNSWSDGTKTLWIDLCHRNREHLRSLRWFVWALSKNEVRIRMLKKAIKIHPVRMFCETRQLNHASIEEIQHMIGDYSRKNLMIFDTSDYRSHELCQLYHYGMLHLEATDPQSVTTGIPYRVFQCAASGRPLLTDFKLGWENQFEPGKEILFYGEENFEETLEKTIKEKDKLHDVGKYASERFLKDHTWAKRLEQILR